MPIIEPLDPEAIDDKNWKRVMERTAETQAPDALFSRIMAHAPGYAAAMHDAMHRSHAMGGVNHKLKEMVRIQLARTAQDTYFANLRSEQAKKEGLTEERIEAACGDFENDPQFSDSEKWALRYSYWMYRDATKLDKDFYDEGKKHFSEAQIMELGAMVALHYGLQVFMRTLKAYPLHDPEGNPVTQAQSEKIYGKDVPLPA